ncbi:MAG: Hpt domain-containing protein [Candidatus Aminicenantes bacterium]|nr:Hpt domain-containing protein [Candidatus Aminicenantes bacterium]
MNSIKESLLQEIIDLPSVLERIGGDESFLQELIKIYIEEFQSKLPKLAEAITTNDLDAVQEIAHSLKGSSANLSLLELQKIAYFLEMASRQGDLKGCQENMTKLKLAFEKLINHLPNFSWWKD